MIELYKTKFYKTKQLNIFFPDVIFYFFLTVVTFSISPGRGKVFPTGNKTIVNQCPRFNSSTFLVLTVFITTTNTTDGVINLRKCAYVVCFRKKRSNIC